MSLRGYIKNDKKRKSIIATNLPSKSISKLKDALGIAIGTEAADLQIEVLPADINRLLERMDSIAGLISKRIHESLNKALSTGIDKASLEKGR